MGRTYFVDPSKEQEAQYAAVQEAQAAAVAALVEGAPMSAAYEAVVGTLRVRGCGCRGPAGGEGPAPARGSWGAVLGMRQLGRGVQLGRGPYLHLLHQPHP